MCGCGSVLAEIERWPDAVAAFDDLLARDQLSPAERVEALARLGYVLVESKDYAGAEEVLRQALAYREEIAATEPLDTDYYVAMARYYLAQIPHRQFAAIPIRLPDKQTERDIEAKAERVLIAHDRYLETVEVGNPYWATAAGYQLASMQKEFWDALVTAPIPPHLAPKAAEYYVQRVHEVVADANRIETAWVDASRREAHVVAQILAREAAGEIVLPGDVGAGAPPLEAGPRQPHDAREYVPGRLEL